MMRAAASLAILFLFFGCSNPDSEKFFMIRHGDELGIDFQNTITTSDTLNALTFEYIYNGSGVGVGDFNNDGLEDLFLGGNQVTSRLYLNQGKLQFKDVTKEAGVSTDRWVTGVSVVDINQDGMSDIFLAVAGKTSPEKMRDLLFINEGVKDGIPVFKESAEAYGIADEGYGTQGVFFDYDKDEDLDLYLLTNALEIFNRNNLRPKRIDGEASSTDRLYRNNGNNTFTNVSREAGILIEGYGLGVNICDINQDSWPDIYVSNDFMSNDLLWINKGDGTFKNQIADYLRHQSHNGMGLDIADFNNDQLSDIFVVDMLPPGHERQKMMTPGQNYDHFHMSENMGYQPQYMRNTLQLNRGKFEGDRIIFSEIAFMAGVSRTDWSWAPLFADFDNDGWKDLFVANGYRKDVTNLDFVFFGLKANNQYGAPEPRKDKIYDELNSLPDVKISNYIYRNSGTLVFQDKTKEWGIDFPTFSNGAGYADFDNDGDLDLITNNIDQEVILYENTADKKADNHFIKLRSADPGVFNQKIWIYTNGMTQYHELTPYRGFQSSVSTMVHAGLGEFKKADSIRIVWTDSTEIVYKNIKADTLLTFSKASSKKYSFPEDKKSPLYFDDVDLLAFSHREKSPSDIKITRTLLHELSRSGPCLATGDVNGDQLDDVFIGGEKGQASVLYVQQKDGHFKETLVTTDSLREDGGALFFDADQDSDLDLYVTASCHSSIEDPAKHLLYLNDGKGKFSISGNLPDISISASCVVSGDYDGDGDADLFVGGKLKAREYPLPARSYILRNDKGVFRDVTEQMNTALLAPGLVSSALWMDLNQDKRMDLVIAGEWMPIRIFINEGHSFSEQTKAFGLEHSHGWWNCLKAADLNSDGFPDVVAGNAGTNSFFEPTVENPVKITAKDFDKNESIDPLITYYNPVEKERFILHNRLVLIDQVPGFKRRFEKFSHYAKTPFHKSFRQEELEGAYEGKASTLASVVFVNEKGKGFKQLRLPEMTQISTINDVLIEDLNGDGHQDLITIGNNYAQETLFGRYDASIGTVLLGDGKFNWQSLTNNTSHLLIEKQAQQIRRLRTSDHSEILLMITINNGPIKTIRVTGSR